MGRTWKRKVRAKVLEGATCTAKAGVAPACSDHLMKETEDIPFSLTSGSGLAGKSSESMEVTRALALVPSLGREVGAVFGAQAFASPYRKPTGCSLHRGALPHCHCPAPPVPCPSSQARADKPIELPPC